MTNALGLVVVGVGINNVRVGWGRREEKRKAHEEAERIGWERAQRRMERKSGRGRREKGDDQWRRERVRGGIGGADKDVGAEGYGDALAEVEI